MGRIQKNVVILGWVSFLTDVSSDMILPVLPLFLANVLGTGKAFIGLIEGVAESTSSCLRVGSGWYSDRLGRRKPLAFTGYAVSHVTKPLLALATSWSHVLAVRFADRVGKGIRTAPRDALIAEASLHGTRGLSFGFHRMMDTAGAVVGASIAFLLLSLMPEAYRTLFALSAIPGFLAVVVFLLFVKERKVRDDERLMEGGSWAENRHRVGGNLRLFLVCISLFAFSTVSYAFLILRANELGVAGRFIPLVYLLYNIVFALFAFPCGSLSDRIGRVPVLGIGMFLHGMVLLGFAAARHAVQAWILFAVYGVAVAITDTVPRAFVADLVATEQRGTALGLYHTAVGVIPLPANLLFGLVWSRSTSELVFALWALLAWAALFLFVLIRRRLQ